MGMTSKGGFRLIGACLMAMLLTGTAQAQSAPTDDPAAPHYKVDPFWPKELPHNWIMGQIGGMTIDSHDHVWVLQRPQTDTPEELGAVQVPKRSDCCFPAPSVLEFDTAGNVIQAWGGPGFVADWPKLEHGIWVDAHDNVWIGGAGKGDRHIIKFTNDGHQIMEIGHPSDAPINNQDTTLLGRPAGMEVDEAAHELYIADGYLNNRVVVYDSDTGKFKRGWGAYGMPLSKVINGQVSGSLETGSNLYSPDAPLDKQFKNPVHCVHIAVDGLVYVCDRTNDRIQVFTKTGKFVKEFVVHPTTRGYGSVWTLNLSHDPQQKYLLVADGEDSVIWVLRRADGSVASSFGHAGRNAGQFHWIHQATLDSKGNYFTGEVDSGKRIQKFILQNGN